MTSIALNMEAFEALTVGQKMLVNTAGPVTAEMIAGVLVWLPVTFDELFEVV